MDGLPSGLVASSDNLSAELSDLNVVSTRDVEKLWKAYHHTNPAVFEGDVGCRLENLFWRVWGNKSLLSTLHGSSLAKMFSYIIESDCHTSSTEHYSYTGQYMGKVNDSTTKKHRDKHNRDKPGHSTSHNGSNKLPLPPILKKSKPPSTANTTPGSGDAQKKARLLITNQRGHEATRNPSNPLTPVPQSSVFASDTSSNVPTPKKSKSGRKAKSRPVRSAKRRPTVMRRKSSQYSSGSTSGRARTPSPPPVERLPLKYDEPDELDEKLSNEWADSLPLAPTMKVRPAPLPESFMSSLTLLLSSQGKLPVDINPIRPLDHQPSRKVLVANDSFRSGFEKKIGHIRQICSESMKERNLEDTLGSVETNLGAVSIPSPAYFDHSNQIQETEMLGSSTSPPALTPDSPEDKQKIAQYAKLDKDEEEEEWQEEEEEDPELRGIRYHPEAQSIPLTFDGLPAVFTRPNARGVLTIGLEVVSEDPNYFIDSAAVPDYLPELKARMKVWKDQMEDDGTLEHQIITQRIRTEKKIRQRW